MNYIGIDIGSTASKVAVKGDHDLHFVLPTGWSSKETCQTIKDRLLEDGIDVLSDDSKVVAREHIQTVIFFFLISIFIKLDVYRVFFPFFTPLFFNCLMIIRDL